MEYQAWKFADIAGTPLGKRLWAFLCDRENVIRMETAVDLGKPAAEAVARVLVESFGDDVRPDRVKQMIGHMIRQIMEANGFQLDSQNIPVRQDRRLFTKASRYRTGEGRTTRAGYINRNNQLNHGATGESGTDHNALAYELECLKCRKRYKANGTDVFQRKCPFCQGGAPGL
ncbi:hypothetical protein [Pseudodesulfovibrio sp.]|uniref:hypothetical protein n=1 Tax=Pseudodesulfovibrio sp. TaxID=2035812 RepID=UPI00262F3638|nr:hypothetical protein [Pseudodesulfovibrio sp.]MDD3311516.1 hypothetical protein [Pseudodesulfovibrio sp.]